ncbi:MAG: transglutaminase family protein [Methylococcaceae bacterium]
MELIIEHRTRYHYEQPQQYSIQQLRLTPQTGFGQQVKQWDVRVNGCVNRYADTFGNVSHTLVLDTPHQDITITATGRVTTGLQADSHDNVLPLAVYLRHTHLTACDGALGEFARAFKVQSGAFNESNIVMMMQTIVHAVTYQGDKLANRMNTAAKAFVIGASTSRDYAHIFIACCRSLGIPARYVSGYLFLKTDNTMVAHNWADVWLGDTLGWQSFDVANGQRANGVHVRLATGLDYRDACPINSVLANVQTSMSIQALAA